MNAIGKIGQIQPTTRVSDAARFLLDDQFDEVYHRLKRSARCKTDDTEHIHQLRVATRRSIALMDVFRNYLSKKSYRSVSKLLKDIRKVAADARDLDVLIENRSSSNKVDRKLLARLKKNRIKVQRPIVSLHQKLSHKKKFKRQVAKLIAKLQKSKLARKHTFQRCSKTSLGQTLIDFFQEMPEDVDDLRQLHQFRIAAKKFRYRIEVLELAFPPQTFGRLIWETKRLQEILGRLNDHAVALACYRQMRDKGKKVDKSIVLEEQAGLDRCKNRFKKWWTIDRAEAIWEHIESLVRNDVPPIIET